MATNKAVRERIPAQKDGPAAGLVSVLLQRKEDSADAVRAHASAAAAGAVGASEDETTAVDHEPSPPDAEEGEVTTFNGTEEEWRAFRENRAQATLVELHELERNPSAANVSAHRTEEESDALRAVNAREPVVITNHETGLEPDAERPRSLQVMPPPEQWPAGTTRENLLAKARVQFEDYDLAFRVDREKRLRDAHGVPHVHPIPVLLFDGETEADYAAAFITSIRRTGRDGTAREFAARRMWDYRARRGVQPPPRVGPPRAAKKRSNADAGRSPPPAPQRQQLGRERLQAGVQQAPTSSAQGYSLSTSPSRGSCHTGASRSASVQHDSVARHDYQSAAPVAHAYVAPALSVAASSSHDVLISMVHQGARATGALERELDTLRQRYDRDVSALSQKCEDLEADVHRLKTSAADEHARSKQFYARYAPRVKALWQHQSVLEDCAGVDDDQRLAILAGTI
ncbi:hypothetical protein FI667_g13398, partial [Globisporangium splendens]